jgi:hypothetical protein
MRGKVIAEAPDWINNWHLISLSINQVPLLYALYSKGYKQSVGPYALYLKNNNIVDKYRVQCVYTLCVYL